MKGRSFALPIAWIVAAVVIAAHGLMPWAAMKPVAADYAYQDTYYVVANWHYGLSIEAACLIFAVVYAVLRLSSAFQRRLAWAHFIVSSAGYALIFGPGWVVPFVSMPNRFEDISLLFEGINWVSSVGYAVSLVGLLIFAWLLADAAARAVASKIRQSSS